MSDDNIRHLWSEAELDDALAALHPHVRTDTGELDRSRAKLLRAAAGASTEGGELTNPPSKKRSGAWQWIAVAAAVAVLTGGVVVASNLGDSSEVRPATTPTSDNRPAAGQYTHVTTNYTVIEWVARRSAFAVQERLEVWIPPDPRELWKRRWTRTGQVRILNGMPADQAALPGPASADQTAPRGLFTEAVPGSAGWTAAPKGWYQPTAEFVTGLPPNPGLLLEQTSQVLKAEPAPDSPVPLFQPISVDVETSLSNGRSPSTKPPTSNRAIPPAGGKPNGPPASSTTRLPPDVGFRERQAGLILSVLGSGLAPRPLREALVAALSQLAGATTSSSKETLDFTLPADSHKLLITIDVETSTVVRASTVATDDRYGLYPGQAISSSEYSYDITGDSGG
ncbi:MAG: hypothetical protein ACRDZY_03970 [Acidimicrobiales bacterium]